MTTLYAYSLVPVLSVALLLFFTALLRTEGEWGLAAFCGTNAFWAASLLTIYFPDVAWLGRRLAASGAPVVAAFLHVAWDFTDRDDYRLVWIAYAAGIAIALAGAFLPGMLYDPVTLSAGPMFWPAMALAVAAAALPLATLARALLQSADATERRHLGLLLAGGGLGCVGAWWNAFLLSRGTPLPWGILMVLGGMLLLTDVVRTRQRERDRRLLERSMLYAAVAAFLSAGFLFGVLTLLSEGAEPLSTEYRIGALFLLFMAALAFEPLRQHLQSAVVGLLAEESTAAGDIADELAEQEKRADHHERLAELGTFTSAIAHEVRNPLGVIRGCIRVLEHRDVDPETLDEMNEQVERAGNFLDELLAYGRERSLELRSVDLSDTVDLAISSARGSFPDLAQGIDFERRGFDATVEIEADQSQLTEVFSVLIENAVLELGDDGGHLRVTLEVDDETADVRVEDDGDGVPEELEDSLFEPFVTGRKRDGPRTGTGLGLAIAKRIVDRHGGTIEAGDAELGGAQFRVVLPQRQDLLAAAQS